MISKQQNKINFIFSILTLLIPIAVGMLLIKSGIGSPNDASRIATIQSIVEQHTLAIDKSILPLAVDIIKIDGKTYSDKPPMLAILGSGIYFIFYHLFHLNLSEHFKLIYYWLTFFLVTIPFGLICYTLDKLYKHQEMLLNHRIILFCSTWLGTLLLPFSVTFTNHLLAAATATIGLYFLLQSIKQNSRNFWQPLWLGFFSALTFTLDLPAGGLMLITFATIYFWKNHRVSDIIGYSIGMFPPLLIHCAVNYSLTGDLIPAYLHSQYYQYPGSVLVSEIGRKRLFGKTILGQYWHMLFGYRGLFLFSPILLFGFIECFKAFSKKYWTNNNHINLLRIAACIILFGTITAYAVQISDFGGTSYGLRWIITSIPLLIYFLGMYIRNNLGKIKQIILAICFVWSVLISFIGLYNPWSLNIISPIPFIDNLAYLSLDYFPNQQWFAETVLEKTSLEKGLAYYELGKYYFNRNMLNQAIPYYYKSIQNDPKHYLSYYHLVIVLDMVGKSAEAIPIYEKLIAIEPDNVGALNNFGISLIGNRQYSRAEAIYHRSIALDSTRPIAYYGLALALAEQNKLIEAQESCQTAIHLNPSFNPAKQLLTAIQNRQKYPKK
jgi:tetratricopeptide (TPR) repeat protein